MSLLQLTVVNSAVRALMCDACLPQCNFGCTGVLCMPEALSKNVFVFVRGIHR